MHLRRRTKQTTSLERRLAEEATRLRSKARSLSPGIQRERAIRQARQAETAIHINEWLRSPGVRVLV